MSEPLNEWIDNNAIDLKEGIKVSFEMFYDDTFEPDFIRAVMMLIRQWHEQMIPERDRLAAELERLKKLYDEWGFADAPCTKHSKPSLLAENCAVCRAEKAESDLAAAVEVLRRFKTDWEHINWELIIKMRNEAVALLARMEVK